MCVVMVYERLFTKVVETQFENMDAALVYANECSHTAVLVTVESQGTRIARYLNGRREL